MRNKASGSSLLFSVLTISGFAILSKIFGFMREGVVAAYFGTTTSSDVFFLALSVYSSFTAIIGSSIAIAFLPIFVGYTTMNDYKTSFRFCANIVNHIALFSFIIIVVTMVFSLEISRLIAPTYSGETLFLLAKYLRILSLTFFFSVNIFLLGAVLDGLKKFGRNQILGMTYSICCILSVVLLRKQLGSMSLIFAVAMAAILQFGILFLLIFKQYKYYAFSYGFKNADTIKLYKLFVPVLLGTGTLYIGQAIDRIIASTLVVGAISALSYSGMIHGVINTLFVSSLVTVFYTEFSKNTVNHDLSSLVLVWRKGVITLLLILVPIAIFFYFNAADIIIVLLKRGAFTDESVKLTALALAFYVLGSPFFGIRNLTTRLFYAIKDSKTPMVNGIVSILLNVILSIVLARYMGVGGITLSSVLTAFVSCILLLFSLNRKKMDLKIRLLFPTAIKVCLSVGIAALGLKLLNSWSVSWNPFCRLIVNCISFLIIYIVSLFFFKCNELDVVVSRLKRIL